MPHIIVEYKKTIGIDMRVVCAALHAEAMQIEAFPIAGLRVRAYPAFISYVGDGDAQSTFIYVTIRIGQGRSDAVKKDIGDRLFNVLRSYAKPLLQNGQPISLGLEVQEIEKEWTWKENNIHQILKDKS